jgi:hypothetical protein
MEERLAIKRSGAWFWQSNLAQAEVLSKLEMRQITPDWLVCPQGSANRAVTVGQFAGDPAIFQRQDQQAFAEERRDRAIAASVEKPILLKIGGRLIQLFLACLFIGGAAVRIFFPHMRGAGLTPTTLMILVPIWSIGGVGLISWVIGRIQLSYQVRSVLSKR